MHAVEKNLTSCASIIGALPSVVGREMIIAKLAGSNGVVQRLQLVHTLVSVPQHTHNTVTHRHLRRRVFSYTGEGRPLDHEITFE